MKLTADMPAPAPRQTSGPARRGSTLAVVVLTVVCSALFLALPARAFTTAEFLATLSSAEVEEFQAWRQARRIYNAAMDRYWDEVEEKRSGRRRKRSAGESFTLNDYVLSLPPTYQGPKLAPDLARKYDRFIAEHEKTSPTPRRELPTVADYLAAAKRVYGFVPERVSEKEFKRRYAEHTTRLGLTKDQVVRVYALETGGYGTYDMQAGIHPLKKTGRAISSALGYAQLLDANSVNELSQSGPAIIERLTKLARAPGNTPERTASLQSKIAAVRKMYTNVKRVPYQWKRHQAYAKTEPGMGVHALNVDGDIGPMLQAAKLKSIVDYASRRGRPSLTGGELELMNLSGPATGMEMMQMPGKAAPTTNFFERRAYYVNKMVIGLTGEGLLAELNRRMDQAVKTPGSVEFAEAFAAAIAER